MTLVNVVGVEDWLVLEILIGVGVAERDCGLVQFPIQQYGGANLIADARPVVTGAVVERICLIVASRMPTFCPAPL